MNQNELLVKKEDNIFKKIWHKIKAYFNNNNINSNSSVLENKTVTNNLKDLKLSDDYQKLIILQRKLENDEISIADIEDGTAEKLIELYNKQIPGVANT